MLRSLSLGPRRGVWFRTLLTCVFVFFALVSGPAHLRRPTQKISPELPSPSSESSIDVIVQFNQVPTDKHYDKVRARGGNLKAPPGLINGAQFSSLRGAVKDLWDGSGVGPALSPNAVCDPTTGRVSIVYDAAAVWGTPNLRICRNAAAWGTSVLLNGTVAVWGAGTTGGFSPVGETAAV